MAANGNLILEALICFCQKSPLIQIEIKSVAMTPMRIKIGIVITTKCPLEYAVK